MSSLARAVLLMDNGYLSKILRDEFGEPRIDYLKLSNEICLGYWCLRTYVYDCLPYQSDPPTAAEKAYFASKSKFFKALESLQSFEIRFGKLRPRPGGFIQKGVDVLLSIDLVRLASKGQIQKAFIIAGDADYVAAVKMAKDEGVSITLYYSGAFQTMSDGRKLPKYSDQLWGVCDDRIIIDSKLINKCKL